MNLPLAIYCFAALAMASVPGARAADGEAGHDGLLLGLRGVGELWQDQGLVTLYRSSRFAGAGVASHPLHPLMRADVEVGYHRMSGAAMNLNTGAVRQESSVVELVPMSILLAARHSAGRTEAWAGLGYALTIFSESSPDSVVSGNKSGLLAQAGVRLDTGLVRPSAHIGAASGCKRLDLEFTIGRRQHQLFGVGEGLDLSAWRASAGMLARF